MNALGQPVVARFQRLQVHGPDAWTYYSYARLANGAWAFRHRTQQRGRPRSQWGQWWPAKGTPDAARLAREYEQVSP